MKLSDKLQKWVNNGFISQEQADRILTSERSVHSGFLWKWLYGIAGLFIGLGVILVISSNWDLISAPVKLLGDFAIWGGVLYGTYISIIRNRKYMKELFLILSFLFVGATIGLVAQSFNLNGGWQSFALSWTLLGLPFVFLSRSLAFNILWLYLLGTSLDFGIIEILFRSLTDHLEISILTITALSLLSYACKKLDKYVHAYVLLPKALEHLSMFMAYITAFFTCFFHRLYFFSYFSDGTFLLAYLVAFTFFGIRMCLAFKTHNMLSFKRNAIIVEFYVALIFITRFGDLFLSGIGFILGGFAVLGLIYLLKRTAKYITEMEAFHE